MAIHETVQKMTDGQRSDLTSTMAGAIPPDFSFEEAQGIIGDKGSFVAAIRAVFAKRRRIKANAVPADGKLFDLDVDYDVDPMSVVITAGYNVDGWKYLGPKLSGKRTLRAKLVRLGFVRNLAEARKKADEMGFCLVEGQARGPFRSRFSKPDGKDPVVFGGSGWQFPSGDAGVACLDVFRGGWLSGFGWSDFSFDVRYRWLVVGK